MLTRRIALKSSLASFALFLPRYTKSLPDGLPEAITEAEDIATLFAETFDALRFDNIHTYMVRATYLNGNNVIQATAWSQTGRLSIETPFDSDLSHVPRMIATIYRLL